MSEPIETSELLRAEVQAELTRRQGHWTAFSTQLRERLDLEARQGEGRSLEAQAIQRLGADVEQAVVDVEARMEGRFRDGVEQRVFRSGIARAPWWRRRWLQLSPAPLALALGVALLVFGPEADARPRSVSVERLSVEGTASVFVEEGVTVVWMESQ